VSKVLEFYAAATIVPGLAAAAAAVVVAAAATPIGPIVGAPVAAAVAVTGTVVVGSRRRRSGGAVFGAGGSVEVGVGGAAAVVTMRCSKGLTGLGVGVMLKAELLKDEEGAGTLEGVRRELGGDDGLDVAVPRIEAAKEVQHLARLGDRVADAAQLIGDALQLGAVGVHRHVTLLKRAQLGFEVDGALQLVVVEEPLDGVPEGERVLVITAHDVVDALGDGREYLVDDVRIDHVPLAIAFSTWSSGADMVLQTKLADGGLEEVAPLTEVALLHVEDDGNMVANGDTLNLGRIGGGDGGTIIG